MDAEHKDQLIRKCLGTSEGQEHIRKSMEMPCGMHMAYSGIWSRVFVPANSSVVDPLPHLKGERAHECIIAPAKETAYETVHACMTEVWKSLNDQLDRFTLDWADGAALEMPLRNWEDIPASLEGRLVMNVLDYAHMRKNARDMLATCCVPGLSGDSTAGVIITSPKVPVGTVYHFGAPASVGSWWSKLSFPAMLYAARSMTLEGVVDFKFDPVDQPEVTVYKLQMG